MMRMLSMFLLGVTLVRADDGGARRILATQCVSCHGAAKMGGLDLRTREAMLAGGSRGAAAVPGNAGESLLSQAVRRRGPLAMPPGKLKGWIDAGAKWSDASISAQSTLTMHDLHGTLLGLLGPDHKRVTYSFQGRDFRLTDVGGENNLVQRLTHA